MKNLDNNKTNILKYLRNEMSPELRQSFEKEIFSNSELKKLIDDMALFEIGLFINEKMEKGHINSESLSRFAEGNIKNETTHSEIEEHLKKCEQCRQLLNLCRLTNKKLNELLDTAPTGFFSIFFDYLVTPRFKFRLIYAPIIFLLLAVPSYFSIMNSLDQIPVKASYELTESIERDVVGSSLVVVKDKCEIIELKFMVPVIDTYIYNFSLYDAEENLILSKPNNKPQKIFALQLPATYLPESNYTLIVDELGDGKEVIESFRFPFDVSYSR